MSNNFEENKITEAEKGRVKAELGRVKAEAERAHAESNEGSGRVEHEALRVEAEDDRVFNEENAESGRVIAESGRVVAELGRSEEYEKFLNDPVHYITPGARTYFRRVTAGYIILAMAFVIGMWALQNESDNRVKDINTSRAQVTYTACEDTNDRNENTVTQLHHLTLQRKETLRKAIIESNNPAEQARYRAQIDSIDDSEAATINLINALAPMQNCKQIVLDRFGFLPDSIK